MAKRKDSQVTKTSAVGGGSAAVVDTPIRTLSEIARRYGTPAYAYDLGRIRSQIDRLQDHLPRTVGLLYSLKANPSLGLCGFIARRGLGADVASAGELITAVEAGFPRDQLFASGPYQSPEVLSHLRSLPDAILSLDSVSELHRLAKHVPSRSAKRREGEAEEKEPRHRALLRLRPDFASAAAVAVGPGSRFGIPFEDLARCREHLACEGIRVVGFHVFAGSQVLDALGVVHHLRGAAQLSLRAAEVLGIVPEILNLGGGFGTPYGPDDRELDLAPVAEELDSLAHRVKPARILIELGRYVVAQAGWYLTTVVARQTHGGRTAVVVDGGTHQRADLCGLGLRTRGVPPLLLDDRNAPTLPTDVLGCLSSPYDVLLEATSLPPLSPGDVLAFPNAGAYGLTSSPTLFHCSPAPAEVAFEAARMELLRAPQPAASLLQSQALLGKLHAGDRA